MSALAGALAALLLGAGIQAWAWRAGARVPWTVAVPLWGALGCALGLGVAAALGVRWSGALILAMAVAGGAALATGFRSREHRPPGRWALLAAALAAPQAWRLAATPAFGWDFRYIWGLKARVFAAAGGYDWSWLAWPGNTFAHPDYPPAWPGLIAAGVVLGADTAASAALWQGILALSLAAACWWVARGAPVGRRTLAAAAGAWAPVIFAPRHSGYAEPLLALAAVVALGALRDLARGDAASLLPLAGGVALMALTKNEGMALAAGVVAGAAAVAGRRALAVALGLLPAAVWRLAVGLHGIGGEPLGLAPQDLARRAPQLVSAFGERLSVPGFVAVVVALVLAATALARGELRGVRWAFATWAAAAAAVYLTGVADVRWWFLTSLDRVLAAPLPALVALAVSGSAEGGPEGGGAPVAS